MRPIQRKTIANKPLSRRRHDGTGRYSAPILIFGDWRAIEAAGAMKELEIICLPSRHTDQVLSGPRIVGCSQGRRCPQPDASPMNLQCVAVNDAGLADEIIRASPLDSNRIVNMTGFDACHGVGTLVTRLRG